MSISATTTPTQVTPHSVVQCLNCGSMAKNFLYLESFLKTNISKKTPCKNCSAVLQYLEYLNKNIEEVFRTIKLSSGKNFAVMNKINSDLKSTNAMLNDVNVLKKPVTRKPSLMHKSKTNLRNTADTGKNKSNANTDSAKKEEIAKEIKTAIRKQSAHDKQPIDKQMKKLKSELSKLKITKKKSMGMPAEKALEKNTKLLVKPKKIKKRFKPVTTASKKLIKKTKTDSILVH